MAYGSFNAGPGKAPDEDVVRTDQIGIPGGIATLDADGHLTESQWWEVDGYKKAETDQRISAACRMQRILKPLGMNSDAGEGERKIIQRHGLILLVVNLTRYGYQTAIDHADDLPGMVNGHRRR